MNYDVGDGVFCSLVTEDDLQLTWSRALMHERGGIVGVRESSWTRVLEELRVARCFTRLWVVVMVSAAELVGAEGMAPALATHHPVPTVCATVLQVRRASGEQVSLATHHGAVSSAFVWGNGHGKIKSVHQAHAVGREVSVSVVEVKLDYGSRYGAASSAALQPATAVAGCAAEAVAVVYTARTGPDAAGPVGGGSWKGAVSKGLERETAPFEDGVAGVRLDGGPNSKRTVVD